MRREIRFGWDAVPWRSRVALVTWSGVEALPAAATGVAIARAVDTGFLAGRPALGLAWLGGLLVAAGVGALGSRQVYRRVGSVIEPLRDDLVRRVVGGALRHGVAGRADDGAVARLSRQVEIVRDTAAGLIVLVNGFVVTVIGVTAGLLTIDPRIAALVVPPFLVGFVVFVAMLGLAVARYRAAVRADEVLARATGEVLAGVRDVTATGAERRAAQMVTGPIDVQAAAERALARTAAQRAVAFVIGGWAPLVLLLVAAPSMMDRGLTAGAIIGGMSYVLLGLQPALHSITSVLGGSGLKYVVTLRRILDATEPPTAAPRSALPTDGHALELRGVTFAYGPHAEPVLRELDLGIPAGDHLAVVGPSGIGKSTLAALLCGLLRPDAGTVELGGAPAADLDPDKLAGLRLLIPQEAYVFAGTLRENLTYLNPSATDTQVQDAVRAVGAEALVERLGGADAEVGPGALSAGERQLLALARAYLSPAPLVVLDEATCHLDPVAERRAEEAFAARAGTLVVIAHRVSSALRARRILVLDGTAAVAGDHATLCATSELYRTLLGHWSLDRDPAALVPARRRFG